MKPTHLFDEESGRTRTITTTGAGVRVVRRSSEVEGDPAAARRAADMGKSARHSLMVLRAADAKLKRARLGARLVGPKSDAFVRRALAALIDRGLLDHLSEEE